MLAGATEASGRIVRAYLREAGGTPQATVLGGQLRAPLRLAAWANGTSGHAMDYDDTQLATDPQSVYGLLTHPTIPVLAGALAAAHGLVEDVALAPALEQRIQVIAVRTAVPEDLADLDLIGVRARRLRGRQTQVVHAELEPARRRCVDRVGRDERRVERVALGGRRQVGSGARLVGRLRRAAARGEREREEQ